MPIAPNRGPVIVLGMHRSGTSCLAGSLQEAGLELGAVITDAPYNRKGNRENPDIMKLNEDVLTANSGSWDNPPEVVSWNDDLRARRDRIIRYYRPEAMWGFKDPRTLFTLDGWTEVLPKRQLVATIRHPASVAASLANRNRMGFADGLSLWTRYNLRLRALLERERFPVVNFDVTKETYLRQIGSLSAALGLNEPAAGFRFFEDGLRHNLHETGSGLPQEVEQLHRDILEYVL